MLLVIGLLVGGAVFVAWWWRSLAAFSRSVHSHNEKLSQLALVAKRGEGRRLAFSPMPDARLKLWHVDVAKLMRNKTAASGVRRA